MITGSRASGTLGLTALAMLAFAANSLLCRLALAPALIDASSFATLRVAAGTLTLAIIALATGRRSRPTVDQAAVLALFGYMVCFSFAYLSLSAGTGALILFGAVQLTMFVAALRAGESFAPLAWVGLSCALLGLVYLVSPGLAAPDPLGATLMAAAGFSWGIYSLRGRRAIDALSATTSNFALTLPLVAIVSLLARQGIHVSKAGVAYALASGTIASGLGYVVWFAAVRRLAATTAATVQLSVPVIAAFGGIVLLGEALSLRLIVASAATLGGIWLVLAQRAKAV
jgi:drug/metabolite transporter (DMT)-like permease